MTYCSDVIEAAQPTTTTTHSDSNVYAHYVDKAEIVEGYVEGKEVYALCGKKFVPSRDPSAFPVCSPCIEMRQNIRAMRGLT